MRLRLNLQNANDEIHATWWNLANAIGEVTDSDTESFAVLETMLEEGRISFILPPLLSSNGRIPQRWS